MGAVRRGERLIQRAGSRPCGSLWFKGDITDQRADAIVNAANSSLLGGGGVDGAIHRRGGSEILEACRKLRASAYGKGLPPGQAVATTGRDASGEMGDPHRRAGLQQVERTGRTCSNRATASRCTWPTSWGPRTVAFPAVSAGIYGWPMDDAARIAVGTVRDTPTKVEECGSCCSPMRRSHSSRLRCEGRSGRGWPASGGRP